MVTDILYLDFIHNGHTQNTQIHLLYKACRITGFTLKSFARISLLTHIFPDQTADPEITYSYIQTNLWKWFTDCLSC